MSDTNETPEWVTTMATQIFDKAFGSPIRETIDDAIIKHVAVIVAARFAPLVEAAKVLVDNHRRCNCREKSGCKWAVVESTLTALGVGV